MQKNTDTAKDLARKVKLIILDVDGVMSDGRIIYDLFKDEFKCFDVHDGLGIVAAQKIGMKVAIISARGSKMIKRRAKDLGVKDVFQNFSKKTVAYDSLKKKYSLSDDDVCFIGDDLVDIAAMKRAGFSVAVANACEDVKKVAHLVTDKKGGRGAIREAIEFIIKSQERWDEVLAIYEN